jgi:hypothetical protein
MVLPKLDVSGVTNGIKMMKISKSVAGLLLVAALMTSQVAAAVALPASSGTLATTTVTLNPAIDDEGGFSAHFGHDFVSTSDYAKYFTNDFTFSVGPGGLTAGSLTATFTKDNKKDVYISSFNIYTNGGNLLYTGVNMAGASNQTQFMDIWVLPDDALLSSGSYNLQVTGQVLGSKGGSYGGDLLLTAVPEPETYAMMIGGLALVGFMTRRRAEKKAA